VAVEISGAPKGTAATLGTIDTKTGLLIGLGALGIALIVAGIWLFRRERRAQADEEDEEAEDEEESEPEADPEQLMDAIIALDDGYKAGELPEEAYLQRRAELKARLENQLKDQA
jgi:cbb3-type cytochrome oxidase subunit 3